MIILHFQLPNPTLSSFFFAGAFIFNCLFICSTWPGAKDCSLAADPVYRHKLSFGSGSVPVIHLIIVFTAPASTVARALDLTVLIALLCEGRRLGQSSRKTQVAMNAKCRDLDQESRKFKWQSKNQSRNRLHCVSDSCELNAKWQMPKLSL